MFQLDVNHQEGAFSPLLSIIIFREIPGLLFAAALILMIIGVWLSSQDEPVRESIRRYRSLIKK